MTEIEIDLGAGSPVEDYSAHTEGLARYALAKGKITLGRRARTARAESLSGPDTWHPALQLGERGEVAGVTCTCPNGTRGGIRARCWHACALEMLWERREHPAV